MLPLKKQYYRVKVSFEGVRGSYPMDEFDFDLPDYEDEHAQSGVDPAEAEAVAPVRGVPYDYGQEVGGRLVFPQQFGRISRSRTS